MQIANWLVALALLNPVASSAFGKPATIEAYFQWKLSLDAGGKVVSLAPINGEYLPAARAQLEPLVRRWHFMPGKLDGRPGATETTLTVQALFTPDDRERDTYKGRILNAHTGSTYRHVVAPVYPKSALFMRNRGRVSFLVKHDGDGHIVSLARLVYKGEPHVADSLVQAAAKAVGQWTFEPETVGGAGVSGAVVAPVCFSMKSQRDPCPPMHSQSTNGSGSADGTLDATETTVVGLDMGGIDHTE